MTNARGIFDSLIDEWFVIKAIDFEQGDAFVVSEELQCPTCPATFYAHSTTIRALVNHVIDHLAERES